jgi:hypothetical protein
MVCSGFLGNVGSSAGGGGGWRCRHASTPVSSSAAGRSALYIVPHNVCVPESTVFLLDANNQANELDGPARHTAEPEEVVVYASPISALQQ